METKGDVENIFTLKRLIFCIWLWVRINGLVAENETKIIISMQI